MSDLPPPPITADTDLRDFPYMPLDVLRLRDSDLAAIEDAEAFRANVLSWCVAWHQVPAASLPDDDAALCRLLGYGRDIKTWKRVRDAGGLRGWMLHSDGRLYHKVVTEKALEAVTARRRQRDRTEAARRARLSHSDQGHVTEHRRPVTERQESVTDDATEVVTRSKGREGKGEEGIKDPPTPHGADAPMGGSSDFQGVKGRGLRANGTNARAVAEAVSATANALKAAEIRRKCEDHPLWKPTRPWLLAEDFSGFLAKCEFVEAGATGSATLIAPSKFVADHIRSRWGDRLCEAMGSPVTIDVRAEAVA